MIAIWRGRAPQQRKPAPAYQPATYDDETVSARAAATPQRYQNTNRRSVSLATRFRYLGRYFSRSSPRKRGPRVTSYSW
jgi:hypothetical protein